MNNGKEQNGSGATCKHHEGHTRRLDDHEKRLDKADKERSELQRQFQEGLNTLRQELKEVRDRPTKNQALVFTGVCTLLGCACTLLGAVLWSIA